MAEGGYRGYITSRPVQGSHFPQRVQNLVVRDYAQRRGLPFRLSLTEYAMPGCTMMLETLLGELDRLDGIVLFSAFTLPEHRAHRRSIFERVLAAGKSLHAALENLVVRTADDAARWDDLIEVSALLPATPFGGRYEKDAAPLGSDAAAMLAAMGVSG
jgi:sporadic carbohydrate cluster protein (TIGR04323 family)